MSRLVESGKPWPRFFVAMDFLTNNVAGWGDAETDLRDVAIFFAGREQPCVPPLVDQFEPDFAELPSEVVALMRP